MEHECLHDELIQDHNLKIGQLETEIQFKKEKIDKLQDSVNSIDEKLDNLIRQSDQNDFNIDNRVTQLETAQKTMKWFVGFGFTVFGLIVSIIGIIVAVMH